MPCFELFKRLKKIKCLTASFGNCLNTARPICLFISCPLYTAQHRSFCSQITNNLTNNTLSSNAFKHHMCNGLQWLPLISSYILRTEGVQNFPSTALIRFQKQNKSVPESQITSVCYQSQVTKVYKLQTVISSAATHAMKCFVIALANIGWESSYEYCPHHYWLCVGWTTDLAHTIRD